MHNAQFKNIIILFINILSNFIKLSFFFNNILVNLKNNVKAFDSDMADGIESGLRRLTNKNGTKVDGFVEYGPNTPAKCYDYYIREGNNFTVVWQTKGYKNHQTSTISPDA